MADNFNVRAADGSTVTIRSTDIGAGIQSVIHRVGDATAAHFLPSGDAVARTIFVTLNDGTNTSSITTASAAVTEATATWLKTASAGYALDPNASAGSMQVPLQVESTAQPNLRVAHWNGSHAMPSGDAAAREIFVGLADGTTGPAAIKAASTAAGATDKALVVSVSPNSPAATNADGSVTGGAVASKSLLGGVQFNAYGSLPALTTTQQGALQADPTGTLKTGISPLGTPIYATGNGAAQANNVTLTIPAAKMGYLDGFDIDGTGATAGSAVAVTITGLLGGTLTFQVGIPAGATVPVQISKRFSPPLQASAVATNIVVNVPSFGTGNLAASTNAYGHYI